MLTVRARLAAVATALCVAATAAACGSGDEDKDSKGSKDTTSATPTPDAVESSAAPGSYLPVPAGVTLTEPGTALQLGDEGVIAFRIDQNGDAIVLGVSVDRIERTSFQESFPGWDIDATTAARTPYFVRLTVTNLGTRDPGGRGLDSVLWADDGSTLEAPNSYTAEQLAACPGGVLPETFPTDTVAELCQVYFIAPDRELVAVSFVPPAGAEPLTWSGELSPVSTPRPSRGPKASSSQSPEATGSASEPTSPSTSPSTSQSPSPGPS
ncbi:hypothetical protein ACFQ0K_13340 [Nocardioides caeni]|uniref:DUF4352 domain-containing protein n=1 Tax=Nocardioides caeni TaxID=574700 RepID=A0A4S8NKM0_9ACTN|nr:hypothetical protein [Nocardioides caeni]THV17610.1 hypothetical protein E9934_03765 [Nocardioides caeni]